MTSRNQNAMGAQRLEMPRVYDAAPERVFREWIDPESVRVWLTGNGEASIDPRPGGLFYLGMAHQGSVNPHYGRYLRVDAPHVVEFTWMSEYTRGTETVVTLEFTPRGAQTELRLIHEGLPDDESVKVHRGGWTFLFDALSARLS